MWRVGAKVPLNVYDGDRPVCQCHRPEDAAKIVTAVNDYEPPDMDYSREDAILRDEEDAEAEALANERNSTV